MIPPAPPFFDPITGNELYPHCFPPTQSKTDYVNYFDVTSVPGQLGSVTIDRLFDNRVDSVDDGTGFGMYCTTQDPGVTATITIVPKTTQTAMISLMRGVPVYLRVSDIDPSASPTPNDYHLTPFSVYAGTAADPLKTKCGGGAGPVTSDGQAHMAVCNYDPSTADRFSIVRDVPGTYLCVGEVRICTATEAPPASPPIPPVAPTPHLPPPSPHPPYLPCTTDMARVDVAGSHWSVTLANGNLSPGGDLSTLDKIDETSVSESDSPPMKLPWALQHSSYKPSDSSILSDVSISLDWASTSPSLVDVGLGKVRIERTINAFDGVSADVAVQVFNDLICVHPGLTIPVGNMCSSFETCAATDAALPAAKYTLTLSPRDGNPPLPHDHFYVLIHDLDGHDVDGSTWTPEWIGSTTATGVFAKDSYYVNTGSTQGGAPYWAEARDHGAATFADAHKSNLDVLHPYDNDDHMASFRFDNTLTFDLLVGLRHIGTRARPYGTSHALCLTIRHDHHNIETPFVPSCVFPPAVPGPQHPRPPAAPPAIPTPSLPSPPAGPPLSSDLHCVPFSSDTYFVDLGGFWITSNDNAYPPSNQFDRDDSTQACTGDTLTVETNEGRAAYTWYLIGPNTNSGDTKGEQFPAGPVRVYIKKATLAGPTSSGLVPFVAFVGTAPGVDHKGADCSQVPSDATPGSAAAGQEYIIHCPVSSVNNHISIGAAWAGGAGAGRRFCIGEILFCAENPPSPPLQPPPLVDYPPSSPSPPFQPSGLPSLPPSPPMSPPKSPPSHPPLDQLVGSCIPTAEDASTASSSSVAADFGLESWAVGQPHNTDALAPWRWADNDVSTLGCNTDSVSANPNEKFISYTIKSASGINGVDASKGRVQLYLQDFGSVSYLTPFYAYVWDGIGTPSRQGTRCTGDSGSAADDATGVAAAAGSYVVSCPVSANDRTITLYSGYRSTQAVFFCVTEIDICAVTDPPATPPPVSPPTIPPSAPWDYGLSTNFEASLGVTNVDTCRTGYLPIETVAGCRAAMTYVNSVSKTHFLYDATNYPLADTPLGCFVSNLGSGLGTSAGSPAPVLFSDTAGAGRTGLTVLCRHVDEHPFLPPPVPPSPPPAPGVPFGSIPFSPPPVPPPRQPPGTCSEATVATSSLVTAFTLTSGDAWPTTGAGDVSGSVADLTHTVAGVMTIDGQYPTNVNIDVTYKYQTSSVTLGGTLFPQSTRQVGSATHLLSVRDNSLCFNYRLAQDNYCGDFLDPSAASSIAACTDQKSVEIDVTISNPTGLPMPGEGTVTTFATVHSLGSRATQGRRAAWLTSESGPPSVYTSDATHLRKSVSSPYAWLSTEYGENAAASRGPTAGDTDNTGAFAFKDYSFSIGLTSVLGEAESTGTTIDDEVCVSLSKPSFLDSASCHAPYSESCCNTVEVQADGTLQWLSGKWIKESDSFLGRSIYRRTPSRAVFPDTTGILYDEIKFTHHDCAAGFPAGLNSIGSSQHYWINGEQPNPSTPDMDGRFPSGLGVIASQKERGSLPYDQYILTGANNFIDRQFDFMATYSDWSGLKADSITGPPLAAFATLNDLPENVCDAASQPQAVRSALYYFAGGGAHLFPAFDATQGNQNFKSGYLFENCRSDTFCLGDALANCDLAPYPSGTGGTITKWNCVL